MNAEERLETIQKLRELNFDKLFKLKGGKDYSYKIYSTLGHKHPEASQCCAGDGDKKCNFYGERIMSHGAHSQDFLDALKIKDEQTSNWRNDAVMFVFQDPSENDLHKNKSYEQKCQPDGWYWVWNEYKRYEDYNISDETDPTNDNHILNCFDKLFRNLRRPKDNYNALLFSVICLFKLKNAYVTNLVKCAKRNPTKEAMEYTELADICWNKFFDEELKIVQPKVVFAFGGPAYDEIKKRIDVSDESKSRPSFSLIKLRHPANFPLAAPFIRRLYFWGIMDGLICSEVIQPVEYKDYAGKVCSMVLKNDEDFFCRCSPKTDNQGLS